MLHCATCIYRNDEGYCTSQKLAEDYFPYNTESPEANDMLLYSYTEGGTFWVGPEFGCVHHKEK